MLYLIVFILLFFGLQLYFRLADRFNIIDKPNQRSSHTAITIRGGGVVFPLAAVLYSCFFHEVSPAIVAGVILISLISLADDIRSLSNKLRLLVHFISVTGLLWGAGAFSGWPWWLIAVGYVLVIGVINAYNFMDGINGITGVYSLVTLSSLLYVTYYIHPFTDPAFIICPILGCIVFLIYNFRKKAKCFAGDVGSVSMGFWISALLLLLVTETADLKYVLFLAVYGVDAVLTIIHRLLLGQNIFEAHRMHFYQVLANERKVPHLLVSSGYGLIQLLVNVMIVHSNFSPAITFVLVCVPLVLIYAGMKNKLMTKTMIG